jgi:cytochrome c peroxidase
MMRSRSLITGILLSIHLLCAFSACKKNAAGGGAGDLESNSLKPDVPANFPVFIDNTSNPLSEEGIELGRMLFYDKRLSGNNMLSCENCHRQEFAFTDALAISDRGVSGKLLTRHAPALFNLAWADKGLFWRKSLGSYLNM